MSPGASAGPPSDGSHRRLSAYLAPAADTVGESSSAKEVGRQGDAGVKRVFSYTALPVRVQNSLDPKSLAAIHCRLGRGSLF